MRFIIISIGLLFSVSSCASDIIDCKNPVDMNQTRQCAEKSLDIVRSDMNKDVKVIADELVGFSGKNNSDSFIGIQKQWLEFVEAQCTEQRSLYGRGSMAGISYITCKELFYKERIKILNLIYKRVMSIP